MVCNVITADKANRLYWLGRYAERVYISLHLLRRYCDKVIDGDISDFNEYYTALGVKTTSDEHMYNEALHLSQLYDKTNIYSINSSLSLANDNGIILRRDITSESLSYLQMSQVILEECAQREEKNITMFQPITDYMLSFFGSLDERVLNKHIRNFIKYGKLVENIDLHIRFNYPFYRIEEAYLSLKEYAQREEAHINAEKIDLLDKLICEEKYACANEEYKQEVLFHINNLILV